MLRISKWSKLITVLIIIAGLIIALPNALPARFTARLPAWVPSSSVSLGLDLQGGSSLLLEVEYDQVLKDRLDNLTGDIRVALRKARILYEFAPATNDAVSVRIRDLSELAAARTLLQGLNPSMGGGVLTVGSHAYDLTEDANGTFTYKISDAYRKQAQTEIVDESIEVVRRRIDELGTKEPAIERQGDDRIVVQVPGLSDPERLLSILGQTAKMTFQLVDESANPEQAVKGIVPIGSELLYQDSPQKGAPPVPFVVQKRIAVAGDRLDTTGVSAGFSQQTGEAVVNFRFDTLGARQFGDVTKENVGRRFAIVLDKKVISAPVIREPILGGSGQISGNFTAQSANDLAVLLRAGALPAPLKVLEQRTVGAELGADSIKAGTYSAIGGLILVALFMVARYGLFGVFANVALVINIVLLLAILTLFGATLTLPGIAGIVLTMGMAVDANVLIYERMREEQRNGRSILASIDQGFQRARATIFDANMTHLIASMILFELGSGPVRGFAVTLGVGILTSFFTAVMVTRILVVTWLEVRRPKRLLI